MTPAEHTAQRDLVTASLAATHHPDTYSNSRTGDHARPAESSRDRVSAVPSRSTPSHAPRPNQTGRDGQGAAPTRDCPRCHGEGEILFRHDWLDPQTEDGYACRKCDGTGVIPVATRQIPGTKRHM